MYFFCQSLKVVDFLPRGRGYGSNFYILDFKNFSKKFHRSKLSVYWCDQQTRRRSACGLHLRRSKASWLNAQVYYTLVDCNLLTPLLRFVLDLSYKLFLHCCAAVGKNSTETLCHTVRVH